MNKEIFIGENHFHYVTFSCFGRRNLLKDSRGKQIVIHVLAKQVREKSTKLVGYVVMPDHVHAILGYNDDKVHPMFMQEWKRQSSILLMKYLEEQNYPFLEKIKVKREGRTIGRIWQRKYYDFNLFSIDKVLEKLNYMHQNPVRRGFVQNDFDYFWSSCQYYKSGKSAGVKISPLE